MDFGPKWKSLQTYLDQTSASTLSGADATAQSLGLHLPFSIFSLSLPLLPSSLPIVRSAELFSKLLSVSSQRSFKQICVILYVRMHAFTSMRRSLTHDAHGYVHAYATDHMARHSLVSRIEHAVSAALRSLL